MIDRTPPVLDRARLAWRVFRAGIPSNPWGQKAKPFAWPAWRDNKPEWHLIDTLSYINEGFNLNALVYSAIMYKARATTAAPLRAWQGAEDRPELAPPNHPLQMLCERPNLYQSRAEFDMLAQAYFNISGNVYVYCDRPRSDQLTTAMRLLRPDRVWIIPEAGAIKGFYYVPEGRGLLDGVPMLPQDVIHIKLPNPGDPLEGMGYGLSPISPMSSAVDVDNDVSRFLKTFFQRGTMASTALSFDDPLEETEVARIRGRWSEIYGGYQNWSEVAVLDHGGKVTRLGMTFQEMGFDGIDERNESRILGPFGVPPILIGSRVGLKRATYSNYEQARKAFWEDTFIPELALFESDYRYYLKAPDAWVGFDRSQVPALRQDITKAIDGAFKLWQMGIPSAIALDTVGLHVPPTVADQEAFVMQGMVPVEQALEPPQPVPPQLIAPPPPGDESEPSSAGDAGDGADGANATEDERQDGAAKARGWSPAAKAAHRERLDAQLDTGAALMVPVIRSRFAEDRRAVLACLDLEQRSARARKATAAWPLVAGAARLYLEEDAAPKWRDALYEVVDGFLADVSAEQARAFKRPDPGPRARGDWLIDTINNQVGDIIATSTDDLATLFEKAGAEGWTPGEAKRQVEDLFDAWERDEYQGDLGAVVEEKAKARRSGLIARSLVIAPLNRLDAELFREWGADTKEWHSLLDGRERDSHRLAHGQRQFLSQPFVVGGERLMYPCDPDGSTRETAGCRCRMLPIFPDEIGPL